MLITRSGFEFTPVDSNAPRGYGGRGQQFPPPPETNKDTVVVKAEGNLMEQHTRNFLECIKSRKQPLGDVVLGHRAAVACHLCTQSYKEKRQIQYDPAREEVIS